MFDNHLVNPICVALLQVGTREASFMLFSESSEVMNETISCSISMQLYVTNFEQKFLLLCWCPMVFSLRLIIPLGLLNSCRHDLFVLYIRILRLHSQPLKLYLPNNEPNYYTRILHTFRDKGMLFWQTML